MQCESSFQFKNIQINEREILTLNHIVEEMKIKQQILENRENPIYLSLK